MLQDSLYINYAKALYKSTLDIRDVSSLLAELTNIKKLLEQSSKLSSYFSSSEDLDKKNTIISIIKKKLGLSEMIFSFFKIIVENNRVKYFSSIIDYYNQMIDKKNNVRSVKLYSNNKITDKEKKIIESFLKNYFTEHIKIDNIVESKILSGYKIVSKSKVIDISALEAIKFYSNILKG